MMKIKFLTIVFTIMFFNTTFSQETIYLPSGEEIQLNSLQEKMKEKMRNSSFLLNYENKGIWIKAEKYNPHTKEITNESIWYTAGYYAILFLLFLLSFYLAFEEKKWYPKDQIIVSIYLILLSVGVAYLASLTPEMGWGALVGLGIGLFFACVWTIFSFIYTGFITVCLTIFTIVISSQIGFVPTFKEVILPLSIAMAIFFISRFLYTYIKNSRRIRSLDL